MPVSLSIKNAPDDLVELPKLSARRHHRSLQGEALAILEEAVRGPRQLTINELLAEVRKLNLRMPNESAQTIREMRDRRFGS